MRRCFQVLLFYLLTNSLVIKLSQKMSNLGSHLSPSSLLTVFRIILSFFLGFGRQYVVRSCGPRDAAGALWRAATKATILQTAYCATISRPLFPHRGSAWPKMGKVFQQDVPSVGFPVCWHDWWADCDGGAEGARGQTHLWLPGWRHFTRF